MIKKITSVSIDTDTMQIFQEDREIKHPWDICKLWRIASIFEYLKDNYSNNEEVLWNISVEARELQDECNDSNPLTELDAIELARKRIDVEFIRG